VKMKTGRTGFFESLVERTTRTSYENTPPIRPALTPDMLPETFALAANNVPSGKLEPRFLVASSSPYSQEVSTPNTLDKEENTTLEGASNKKTERDHYMPQTETLGKKISNTTGKPAVSDRPFLADNPRPAVRPETEEEVAKGSTSTPLPLSEKSPAEPFSSFRGKKSANSSQKDVRATVTSAKPNRVVSPQDIRRDIRIETNMDNDRTDTSSPAESSSEQRQSDDVTSKVSAHVNIKPAPISSTPVDEISSVADSNPPSLDDTTYVSESTRTKKSEPSSPSTTEKSDRADVVTHSRIYPQGHNMSSPTMTRQRQATAAQAQDRDVVNINIGRIEVKAVFPQRPGPAASSKNASNTLSLSEYLKMRAEGKL
jgi:hypothetical protein